MDGAGNPAIQPTLADRVRGGDKEAEEELVRRFYKRVLLMARVRLGDQQAALDIAQETMIGVLEALRLGRVNNHLHLSAYVLGTARNLVNNHIRTRARASAEQTFLDREVVRDDPERLTAERERFELVERALRELSQDDQEILRMTLVEGLNPREIADRTGLSRDVVRKRKSRAAKRLRSELEDLSRTERSNHSEGETR